MGKIDSRVSVAALQKGAEKALEHCLVERGQAQQAKNHTAYQELGHTMFNIHAIRLNFQPPHAHKYANLVRSRTKRFFKTNPQIKEVFILLGKTGKQDYGGRDIYLALKAPRRTGRVEYDRVTRRYASIDIPSMEKHEACIAVLV